MNARRKLRGYTAGLALILLSAAVLSIRANPAREPQRLIDNQAVNLTPLLHWWTNRAGARPLAAWVRVTGRVVATNGFGWVVQGHVEHTPHATQAESEGGRVVLRHPPLAERAEFDRLKAQLQQLEEQRAGVARQQGQLQSQSSNVAKEQNAYRKNGLRDRALAREGRALKASETETKAELKPLDQRIKEVKKQLAAFPNPDHYEVDCFALDTGQAYEQLPVFDHGAAFK